MRYVPLNTVTTYEQTGEFARAVAEHLSDELAGLAVFRYGKSPRAPAGY